MFAPFSPLAGGGQAPVASGSPLPPGVVAGVSGGAARSPRPSTPSSAAKRASVVAVPHAGVTHLSGAVAIPLSMRRALARARKDKKSDFFLRMQPQPAEGPAARADAHRPPLGLPVRELLTQAYNYKRVSCAVRAGGVRRGRARASAPLEVLLLLLFFKRVLRSISTSRTARRTACPLSLSCG